MPKIYGKFKLEKRKIRAKHSENFDDTEEQNESTSPRKAAQEGTINSLIEYKTSTTIKNKKKPGLRKFGSAEYSMTPKGFEHLQFYKKTFENFNDAASFSKGLMKTFTHKKPSVSVNKLADL